MPGIFGVIGASSRGKFGQTLKQMMASMQYEPLYSSGSYLCPALHVEIGWICRRPSVADDMPIVSQNRDLLLFLFGEPTSDLELANQVEPTGDEPIGANVSRLFQLYRERGECFLKAINGVFAGFLIDLRKKECLLFNDRYGIERLFLHYGKDRTFFASEAKAILEVVPETRSFDGKGLCEFLTYGCTLENKSLFRGIEVLQEGSVLRFPKRGSAKQNFYFRRSEWEELPRLSESQFVTAFLEAFPLAVERCSKSAGNVAVSLTGGLDSRMIMACLKALPGTVPCYTFGSMYRETFDVKVASLVAKQCGQTHKVFTLSRDYLNRLPVYLEKAVFVCDGYLGLSGAAELYLNALARSEAPVRITGNYGGELLRGVRSSNKYSTPRGNFLRPEVLRYLEEVAETCHTIGHLKRLSSTLFHQIPSQGYGRYAIERSQVALRSPFLDNSLVKLLYQAPAHFTSRNEPSVEVIAQYRPDLLEIPTDRGLLGSGNWVTRTSQWLYREALFKAEYRTGHGAPDWLAKFTRFSPLSQVEGYFVARHKFQHFRSWLQKELAPYVWEVLFEDSEVDLDQYLNGSRVKEMVRDHVRGRANYTHEVDKILTIALTQKLLLRAPICHA
jgi:asparagine synthase (glutamine-hydrolysing)